MRFETGNFSESGDGKAKLIDLSAEDDSWLWLDVVCDNEMG